MKCERRKTGVGSPCALDNELATFICPALPAESHGIVVDEKTEPNRACLTGRRLDTTAMEYI